MTTLTNSQGGYGDMCGSTAIPCRSGTYALSCNSGLECTGVETSHPCGTYYYCNLISPTTFPTKSPTKKPTSPTQNPTKFPTNKPTTPNPTQEPTNKPVVQPTTYPTRSPVEDSENVGIVYLFNQLPNGTWYLNYEVQPSGLTSGDNFGEFINIENGKLISSSYDGVIRLIDTQNLSSIDIISNVNYIGLDLIASYRDTVLTYDKIGESIRLFNANGEFLQSFAPPCEVTSMSINNVHFFIGCGSFNDNIGKIIVYSLNSQNVFYQTQELVPARSSISGDMLGERISSSDELMASTFRNYVKIYKKINDGFWRSFIDSEIINGTVKSIDIKGYEIMIASSNETIILEANELIHIDDVNPIYDEFILPVQGSNGAAYGTVVRYDSGLVAVSGPNEYNINTGTTGRINIYKFSVNKYVLNQVILTPVSTGDFGAIFDFDGGKLCVGDVYTASIHCYVRSGDTMGFTGSIAFPGLANSGPTSFGNSLDIGGEWMVVGAKGSRVGRSGQSTPGPGQITVPGLTQYYNNVGELFVFKYEDGWNYFKTINSKETRDALEGALVSITDDGLYIAQHAQGLKLIIVYKFNGDEYVKISEVYSLFVFSLVISHDYLFFTAQSNVVNRYRNVNDTFVAEPTISIGSSISYDGLSLAVGNAVTGSVDIYTSPEFVKSYTVKYSEMYGNDELGRSVHVKGNILAVGATGVNSRRGSAYVFDIPNTKQPTSSPTSSPTSTPTLSPTQDKSYIFLNVKILTYDSASDVYSELDASSVIRLKQPIVFFKTVVLNQEVISYNSFKSFSSKVDISETKITHIDVDFDLVGEPDLQSNKFILITAELMRDNQILFSEVRRFTLPSSSGCESDVQTGYYNTFNNNKDVIVNGPLGICDSLTLKGKDKINPEIRNQNNVVTGYNYYYTRSEVLSSGCKYLKQSPIVNNPTKFHVLEDFHSWTPKDIDLGRYPLCVKLHKLLIDYDIGSSEKYVEEILPERRMSFFKRYYDSARFFMTASNYNIVYNNYVTENVLISNTDIKARIKNHREGSTYMSIGKISLLNEFRKVIKTLQASDITVLQGNVKTDLTNYKYCPVPNSKYVTHASCQTEFGDDKCCKKEIPWEFYKFKRCVGTFLTRVTFTFVSLYNLNTDLVSYCRSYCEYDSRCIGFTKEGIYRCNFYETISDMVSEDKKIDNQFYECHVADEPISVYKAATPIFVIQNNFSYSSRSQCRSSGNFTLTESNGVGFCSDLTNLQLNPTIPEQYLYFPTFRSKTLSLAEIEFNIPSNTKFIRIEAGDSNRVLRIYSNNYFKGYNTFQQSLTGPDKQTDFDLVNIKTAYNLVVIQEGVELINDFFDWRNDTGIIIQTYKLDAISEPLERDTVRVPPKLSLFFDIMCKEDVDDFQSVSNTIHSIFSLSRIDLEDKCDDLDSFLKSNDLQGFVDNANILIVNVRQQMEYIGRYFTGDWRDLLELEFKNPKYPVSIASLSVTIQFLHFMDVDINCSPTMAFDSYAIAKEIYYAHVYPGRYIEKCGGDEETYYLRDGKKYSTGLSNAPCVTNAQCRTPNFVCKDFLCQFNASSTCPSGEALIVPAYYGVVPKNPDVEKCGKSQLYNKLGIAGKEEYCVDIPPFNKEWWEYLLDGITFFESPFLIFKGVTDLFNDINVCEDSQQYYQDHWNWNCKNSFRRVYGEELLSDWGNAQECGTFDSDEFVETAFSFRSPLGPYACGNFEFLRKKAYDEYKNHYHRLIPHFILDKSNHHPFKYVEERTNIVKNEKTFSSPIGFADSEMIESILSIATIGCSIVNEEYGDAGFNFEMDEFACEFNDGCIWNPSLSQCVADRKTVEKEICGYMESEQCILIGFCKLGSDGCEHKSSEADSAFLSTTCAKYNDRDMCIKLECYWDIDENTCVSPEGKIEDRNKILCKLMNNPAACGHNGCFWDLLEHQCKLQIAEVYTDVLSTPTYRLSQGGFWNKFAPQGVFNYYRPFTHVLSSRFPPDYDFKYEENQLPDDEAVAKWLDSVRGPCEKPPTIYKSEEQISPVHNYGIKIFQLDGFNTFPNQYKPIIFKHTNEPLDNGEDVNSYWSWCAHISVERSKEICVALGFEWSENGCLLTDEDYYYDVKLWKLNNVLYSYHMQDFDNGIYQYSWEWHKPWDGGAEYQSESNNFQVTVENRRFYFANCNYFKQQQECPYYCYWLNKLEYCASKKEYNDIHEKVFLVPSLTSPDHVSKFYNVSYGTSISNGWNWNVKTSPRLVQTDLKPILVKNLVCQTNNNEQCADDIRCYWDWIENKCEISYCPSVHFFISDVDIKNIGGNDPEISNRFVHSCERVHGCYFDEKVRACLPMSPVNKFEKQNIERIYCDNMLNFYDICNFYEKYMDFVCIQTSGFCKPRVPKLASVGRDEAMILLNIYNDYDVEDDSPFLELIFNYFNDESFDVYNGYVLFMTYFTHEELEMNGLNDFGFSLRDIEGVFEDAYENFTYSNLVRVKPFDCVSNCVEYFFREDKININVIPLADLRAMILLERQFDIIKENYNIQLQYMAHEQHRILKEIVQTTMNPELSAELSLETNKELDTLTNLQLSFEDSMRDVVIELYRSKFGDERYNRIASDVLNSTRNLDEFYEIGQGNVTKEDSELAKWLLYDHLRAGSIDSGFDILEEYRVNGLNIDNSLDVDQFLIDQMAEITENVPSIEITTVTELILGGDGILSKIRDKYRRFRGVQVLDDVFDSNNIASQKSMFIARSALSFVSLFSGESLTVSDSISLGREIIGIASILRFGDDEFIESLLSDKIISKVSPFKRRLNLENWFYHLDAKIKSLEIDISNINDELASKSKYKYIPSYHKQMEKVEYSTKIKVKRFRYEKYVETVKTNAKKFNFITSAKPVFKEFPEVTKTKLFDVSFPLDTPIKRIQKPPIGVEVFAYQRDINDFEPFKGSPTNFKSKADFNKAKRHYNNKMQKIIVTQNRKEMLVAVETQQKIFDSISRERYNGLKTADKSKILELERKEKLKIYNQPTTTFINGKKVKLSKVAKVNNNGKVVSLLELKNGKLDPNGADVANLANKGKYSKRIKNTKSIMTTAVNDIKTKKIANQFLDQITMIETTQVTRIPVGLKIKMGQFNIPSKTSEITSIRKVTEEFEKTITDTKYVTKFKTKWTKVLDKPPPSLLKKFKLKVLKGSKIMKKVTTKLTKNVLSNLPGPFDLLDVALMAYDGAMAYTEAYENPVGCRYLEGDQKNVAIGLETFFKHVGVILGGDSSSLISENICSERPSFMLYNEPDKFAFRDYRYNPPQCSKGTYYNLFEGQVSDQKLGYNIDCMLHSDCTGISSTGRCVLKKCVFPLAYIGMKQCGEKAKTSSVTVPINVAPNKVKLLDTSYYLREELVQQKYEYTSDPLGVAYNWAKLCNYSMYFEISFLDEGVVDRNSLVCFDECNSWVDNVSPRIETYIVNMPNVTNYNSELSCEDSTDCNAGSVCIHTRKCREIECYDHTDCYGNWEIPGRLHCCSENNVCVDTITNDGCDDIDSCAEKCQAFNPIYPTPSPTFAVTESPTVSKTPTLSPTVKPTAKPTAKPTNSPTTSPTELFINPSNGLCNNSFNQNIYYFQNTLFSENKLLFQEFGKSTVIYKDYLFSGAPGKDNVYLFKRVNDTWMQTQVISTPVSGNFRFGTNIKVLNDTLFVAAPLYDTNLNLPTLNDGAVFIFKNVSGIWQYSSIITGPESYINFNFGSSLTVSYNSIIIGASGFSKTVNDVIKNRVGAFYIYSLVDDTWTFQFKLDEPEDRENRNFGSNILLDSDNLFVSSEGISSKGISSIGSVHYYKFNGSSWNLMQILTTDENLINDRFGYSLSKVGDLLFIGAPKASVSECPDSDSNHQPGAVYMFELINNLFVKKNKIFSSDRANNDLFGSSVLVFNNTLIVGSEGKYRSSGAVYVYNFNVISNRRRSLAEGDEYDFGLSQEFIDSSDSSSNAGSEISSDGETLAVSGTNRDLSGTVYLAQLQNDAPVGGIITTPAPTQSPTVKPTLQPTTEAPTPKPTLSTPFTGETCNFTQYNNTNCIGTNLNSDIVSPISVIECDQYCRNNANCAFYKIHITGVYKCSFYSNYVNQATDNNFNCVVKNIPCIPTASPTNTPTNLPTTKSPTLPPVETSNVCEYTYSNNTYIGTNTFASESRDDLNVTECLDLCSGISNCFFMSYDLVFGTCSFIESINLNFTTTGYEVYIKQNSSTCITSYAPTNSPTKSPTKSPTQKPIQVPTLTPTRAPVVNITNITNSITLNITTAPTSSPTVEIKTCGYNEYFNSFCQGTVFQTLTNMQNTSICRDTCTNLNNCAGFNYVVNSGGQYNCNFIYYISEIFSSTTFKCAVKNYTSCNNDLTRSPTNSPTVKPTANPTSKPTVKPTTSSPSSSPTLPSVQPTLQPTSSPVVISEACEYLHSDIACGEGIGIIQPIYYGNDNQTCVETCNYMSNCIAIEFNDIEGYCIPLSNYTGFVIEEGFTCKLKQGDCYVESPSPTVSPSISPTMSPSNSTSNSPSTSPTSLSPTISPTLPSFCEFIENPSTTCSLAVVMQDYLNVDGSVVECKNQCSATYNCIGFFYDQGVCTFISSFGSYIPRSEGYRCYVKQDQNCTHYTNEPTGSPSTSPSTSPSVSPSVSPTVSPTGLPSVSPTVSPTRLPSSSPSTSPSMSPINSTSPTVSPSTSPTVSPSTSPTVSPTTLAPTREPNSYTIIDVTSNKGSIQNVWILVFTSLFGFLIGSIMARINRQVNRHLYVQVDNGF